MNTAPEFIPADDRGGFDPAASDPETQRSFRNALGQFATGVTVITGLAASGERVGITVTSFNSLSLDPPLILWSLGRDGGSFSCFQVGAPFAVNVLAGDQKRLAERFACVGIPKFEGVATHAGLDNVPLIAGCAAYFECLVEMRHPGGDHDIIIGRVRRLFNVGSAPLLFHKGLLRPLSES